MRRPDPVRIRGRRISGSLAASPEPSASSSVTPAAGDVIQYPDAADPVRASRLELDLVRQIRDEAGMPALLGDGGPAAFAALDGIEAAYGRKVLLDAANAIDGTAVLGGKAGMPAAPRLGPAVIDTSLFAETGFMANALMSMLTTLVQRAGSNGSATVPREEHFQSDEGGLHQDVTLSTTITVKTGDGRASGEVRISATDRITKPDGTFVALYTSSAEGELRCQRLSGRRRHRGRDVHVPDQARAQRRQRQFECPLVRGALGPGAVPARRRRRRQAPADRGLARPRRRRPRARFPGRTRPDGPIRLDGDPADRHRDAGRWRDDGERSRRDRERRGWRESPGVDAHLRSSLRCCSSGRSARRRNGSGAPVPASTSSPAGIPARSTQANRWT